MLTPQTNEQARAMFDVAIRDAVAWLDERQREREPDPKRNRRAPAAHEEREDRDADMERGR